MPVRSFADSGVVRTAVGSCNVSDPFTWVALVRPEEVTEWLIARQNESHEGAFGWTSFGVEANNPGLYLFPEGGVEGGFNPPRKQWVLLVGVKPDLKTKSTYYVYDFVKKEWIVKESKNTWNSKAEGVPAEIQFGRYNAGEQFQGRYAAAAIFNKALTEEQVKSLISGSIEDWLSLTPVGHWMFNQTSVEEEVKDNTGNGANQSSRVGTTVTEEEPPIPYKGGTSAEVKAVPASLTLSFPTPVIVAGQVIEAPAATLTLSAPTPNVAAGALPSPTNERRGLPLPFPSVLANPSRLGPPRFSAAERKALGLGE